MSIEKKHATMHVYGCGGAGLNIVGQLITDGLGPDVANIKTSFIDTSRSNIRKEKMSENDIYILPDIDGSGKIREENHKEINNVIKDIMVKHKPADFNIVVFSLSGGSGSVIGPLLISEMLSRDLPVVSVCIGTDESVLTANNTMKSLKSLDAISKRNKKPVVMAYEHNFRGAARSKIDNTCLSYITSLSHLVSGMNDELDSQDLENWLDFTRTCQLGPQLVKLDIYSSPEHVKDNHKIPISIASLYQNRDNEGLTVTPDYHCAGYKDLSKINMTELHYVIDTQGIPVISKRIEETLNNQREVADSRGSQVSVVSSNDRVEDNGLVL